MRSEEQIRAALVYYVELESRARDYWDDWQGYVTEGDARYALYQEYKAKREALEWALGMKASEADAPPHTVFPPDLKGRGQ